MVTAIARRHGTDWFVGAITNSNPRKETLRLDFLEKGNYVAEIYTDAADTDKNPNHLKKETRTVNSADVSVYQTE